MVKVRVKNKKSVIAFIGELGKMKKKGIIEGF
jgi:ribosomal protein S12